jgi:hypothetical protein
VKDLTKQEVLEENVRKSMIAQKHVERLVVLDILHSVSVHVTEILELTMFATKTAVNKLHSLNLSEVRKFKSPIKMVIQLKRTSPVLVMSMESHPAQEVTVL